MNRPLTLPLAQLKLPLNLRSTHFAENKHAYYSHLREHDPVHRGKVLPMVRAYLVARYEDCVNMSKDKRLVRNRATATGGSSFPLPIPKSVQLLSRSMITVDDPDHRRLRTLVHKAFTPRAIAALEGPIETLTHSLLDAAQAKGSVDLMTDFALPIPVAVIAGMVGVDADDLPTFTRSIKSMTTGMSGFGLFKTLLWDMPKLGDFVREIVAKKRANPADDILTRLVHATEDGDSLTEDEVVAMVFLMIGAGYETTYNLITNAVYTLLTHPEQLARLRADPSLIGTTIEEVLRFNGPVHGTKPTYATEDLTISGVAIAKGSMVFPLLGSANRDPEAFERPNVFDIGRTPNRHLGFGMGAHYCLGAPLARMETKIALLALLERNPNLRLAVPEESLELVARPAWHMFKELPVAFG